MDGEPIENEFDTNIPVDEGDAEASDGQDDSALTRTTYDEPKDGSGPGLTDETQDEHPTPVTDR